MGEGIRTPYYSRKQWTGSMDRSSGCVSLNQNDGNRHPCPKCYRSYKHRSHMIRHYRYECGTPQRFECPYCKHHLRQRTHVWTHIRTLHPNQELYCIDIGTNARLTRQEHKNEERENCVLFVLDSFVKARRNNLFDSERKSSKEI
ncbi:hypothetical protein HZH66_011157 [Vespula vulgaris]|uniref:C2H2-type domain-containing protein n=1 Tax=Vespula vulgaris TaxID=7454 RepID=A0A834MW65_VESVU|nr:hypothetical protein HZH66_011157 [Vespula vulgaris]